jgi:hypothetical protein
MNNRLQLEIWQEEESFTTELMTGILKKPFYIIECHQPPETLYRLIFKHEESEKAYLSYIKTHLRDKNEKRG